MAPLLEFDLFRLIGRDQRNRALLAADEFTWSFVDDEKRNLQVVDFMFPGHGIGLLILISATIIPLPGEKDYLL